MIELGIIDICTEVSLLSSYMAMPQRGHLKAALHVMSYLKIRHNSRLVLDPSYPTIDEDEFKGDLDRKEFYGGAEEAVPHNAPRPRGKEVVWRVFVDPDHAGTKPIGAPARDS